MPLYLRLDVSLDVLLDVSLFLRFCLTQKHTDVRTYIGPLPKRIAATPSAPSMGSPAPVHAAVPAGLQMQSPVSSVMMPDQQKDLVTK